MRGIYDDQKITPIAVTIVNYRIYHRVDILHYYFKLVATFILNEFELY